METTSDQTPSGPPENPPTEKKKKRWFDVALLVFGALCLVLFGLSLFVRFKQVPVPNTPVISGEIVPDLESVDRIPLQTGAAEGYNVLVVTMDTTRADHIACYGNKGIRTPNIDALAQNGVLCAKAYTPSPSTLPGHSTIFTGLYPHHHGARANGTFKLGPEQVTLAEILKEHGYATGAAISAYVLDSRFGLDQGFDLYHDDLTKGVQYSDQTFRERPAEYTNEVAFDWLNEHKDSRFFFWIHYFDVHAPYVPPEPFRSQYQNAFRCYDGEIAYVDQQLGRLIAKLEELGLRDKTIVVLAGDHGEGLGEHGEVTHSILVYDPTLHTPLIFNAPSLFSEGLVLSSQVCNTAIVPTILDMLGIQTEHGFDAVSLMKPASDRPEEMYIENIATLVLHGWAPLFGIRTSTGKYIHAPKPEFYDIVNDPHETANLFDQRTQDVAHYAAVLKEQIGDDAEFGETALAQAVTMDAATAAKLQALGYVGTVHTDAVDIKEAYQNDPKDMIHNWEKLQTGMNMIAAGQIVDGTVLVRECVEEVPTNVWALRSLSTALAMQGQLNEAIDFAKRANEIEKRDPALYVQLARLYTATNKLAAANEALEEAAKVEPNFPGIFIARASIAMQSKDYEEAEQLYRKAISLDPGTTGPTAYGELGMMFMGLMQPDKAREAFEKAIEIDALNGTARGGLGAIEAEEGNYDAAMEQLTLALRYSPGSPVVLAMLSGLYLKKGDLEQATTNAEHALKINPKCVPALNNLGLVQKRSGDLETAIATFEKALELQKSFLPCRINLAQCYATEGQEEKAAEELERVLAFNPRIPLALFNLGAFHANRGQWRKAGEYFERAVIVDPDYALAQQQLGFALLKDGKTEAALRHLRKSLELDPNLPTREQTEHEIRMIEEHLKSD